MPSRRAIWLEWFRVVAACAIAVAVLLLLILLVAPADQAEALWGWISRAALITGIWLVAGPVWGMFETAPAAAPAGSGRRSPAGEE